MSNLHIQLPLDFEKRYQEARELLLAEIVHKSVKGVKSKIDYSDKTLKKEFEKKWEIIKILYSKYIANDMNDKLVIPHSNFLVSVITNLSEVNEFLDRFNNIGCFKVYREERGNYVFEYVNEALLTKQFIDVKQIYKRFADTYKNKLKQSEQKKSNLKPFSDLPIGIKWQDITIRFINDYDVEINIKGKEYKSDYNKMGFSDARKDQEKETKPVEAWKFFRLIAINSCSFPLSKYAGTERTDKIILKKTLTNKLKKLFPTINDEPFYAINKLDTENEDYRIKLNLIPNQEFISDFEDTRKKISDQTDDSWRKKDYLGNH